MSKIEWTDETHQVVAGCTKVSPGCDHCYAERMSNRLAGQIKPDGILRFPAYRASVNDFGRWSGRVVPIPGAVERLAAKCASWRKPRRVFIQSMGDLFHDQVPFELVDGVVTVATEYPRHTFMLLTKRPARMRDYFSSCFLDTGLHPFVHRSGRVSKSKRFTDELVLLHEDQPWPLPNLWLGVTAENQEQADARIPVLLDTPAAMRFVSIEPMLGQVDLANVGGRMNVLEGLGCDGQQYESVAEEGYEIPSLDWVICGGETGPGARHMNPKWATDLRDQCKASGVPFFFKKMDLWWGRDNEAPGHLGLDVRQFPKR